MFGNNPVAPIIARKQDGSTLQVVAPGPWETIQGEGPYAGQPATFIRLHGCNLRCTFCDTQFSNPDDPHIPVWDLVAAAQRFKHRLVVITGGEPFRQNILPLCKALHAERFLVQIETAGTLWIDDIHSFAKIIVSPKTPTINKQAKHFAMAFKYVISAEDQHERFIPITSTQPDGNVTTLAAPRSSITPVYLSPMDQYDEVKNAANRKLVAELAIRYDVNAGVQLHKYLMVD